jgi:hypothetical protein
VFGIGELGRREIGAREIEEKLHISPVWRTKEIRERESLNAWGPHISDSPILFGPTFFMEYRLASS